MTKKWLKDNWVNFTPLILCIIFAIVYIYAERLMFSCNHPDATSNCSVLSVPTHVIQTVPVMLAKEGHFICDSPENRKIIANAYSRQFLWLFLIGVNVFLCAAALLVFSLLASKSVSTKYLIHIIVACLLVLGAGLYYGYGVGSPILGPVIDSTINQIVGQEPFKNNEVKKIISFVNSVTTMAALATALTLCMVLLRRPKPNAGVEQRKPDGSVENSNREQQLLERRHTLLEQVDDLRLILYMATILLVIGILRLSAVLSWALAFISEAGKNGATDFFANYTFICGASYTLLLASIYLPAYYILKNRATELVREIALNQKEATDENGTTGGDDLLEKFKSEFFTFSIKDSLPRIIAIIAPFLTATFTEEYFINLFK